MRYHTLAIWFLGAAAATVGTQPPAAKAAEPPRGEAVAAAKTAGIVRVALDRYSGRTNPAWTIDDPKAIVELANRIDKRGLRVAKPKRDWQKMVDPARKVGGWFGGFVILSKGETGLPPGMITVFRGVIAIGAGVARAYFADSNNAEGWLLEQANASKKLSENDKAIMQLVEDRWKGEQQEDPRTKPETNGK